MPRQTTPSLRRHKRSGNAYAYFNRQQVWFGPFDDPCASRKPCDGPQRAVSGPRPGYPAAPLEQLSTGRMIVTP